MGWKSGAAAGAAAGILGGPIGSVIGAGIGAFLGGLSDDDADESDLPSIYLTEEGISFRVAEIMIPWDEILRVEFNKDGVDVYTLVGGIEVYCPTTLARYDNEENADRIDKIMNRRISKALSIEETMSLFADGDSVASLLKSAEKCVASVEVCKRHLSALQADENLAIGFFRCSLELFNIAKGLRNAHSVVVHSDNYDAKHIRALRNWATNHGCDHIELGDYFIEEIAQEILNDYIKQKTEEDGEGEDIDISELANLGAPHGALIAAYELIMGSELSSRDFDKSDYALFHAAVSTADSIESNELSDRCIEWLAREFTKEEHAKERKLILCTDDPRNLSDLKTEIPGVAILRADVLEMAKDKVNEPFDASEEFDRMENLDKTLPTAKKLEVAKIHYEETKGRFFRFEVGHPKSGVTYVQHPLVQNRYIDIQSYNTSLLERKYDELIEILTSIGATRISCSVENEQSRGGKQTCRRNVDGEVNSGTIGEVSGSYEGQKFSEKTSALNKRLSCSITRKPNQHPCMPEKTIFYPFEDRWQMMVKDVLSGQRTHEEVDLSYKKEYSLSENETRKIAGKVESLIPTFQFGGSANYSDEYEAELRELESIVWHYEVDFGNVVATDAREDSVANDEDGETFVRPKDELADSSEMSSKAEQLFLKRARRYAQSEGNINMDQRADLEAFAQKYGIDDFRMEELIEEAFE